MPVKSPWMEHPASQRNLLLSTGSTPLMHDTLVKPTIAPTPTWPCGGKSMENHYGLGGLKEQVQQSVNFSEHANHETGHSRLRNIVTTWRLNEPSLPD